MIDILKAADVSGGHNLTKLFSQAPAPIAIYKGRELRYVFINDAYSLIFNHRKILGKTIREAFPELEGQPFFGILENVFDSGNPYHGNETPALIDLNNDGNLITRYYNLVYTPYKNDDGIIEGVMAFGHDVTDQVETRKKEHASDLRFKNIVQQSADPILILMGKDLVLDVANDALLKLWNVGQDAIGKPFLEILPEMKDQVFTDLLLDVYHNGKTHFGYETEGYFKRPNGEIEIHFFNFIYQPYRETDGRISGVLILATDVTEQVIAKKKLAQTEINFRNMILQAPVAIAVLKGSEYIIEIANDLMHELWGKHESEVMNKPVFEGLPEAKGQGLEVLLDEVYKSGNRFTASERPVALPRNGRIETTYLNFVYEPLRGADGIITGIIAVGNDVTEQVNSRRKIEIAEENARLAIESGGLGTFEVDLATNDLNVSQRFNEIWGFDENINDRALYVSKIHPDDKELRRVAHKESLVTGSLRYETRINYKDNSTRWIRVRGSVIFDEDKKPLKLLGFIQDITEQKEFAENLSTKVEERTKALQEVNDRLERSNEELEQFAFVTSHDLQEPLRKIQLFSNLALENGDKEKVTTYLEKVNSSAARMAGLIKDLLEYSRLSQEGLQFKKVDLNEVLELVLIDFEVLISQKNAVIKAEVLPELEAIPFQMNQILFNLIGNALKFTRRDVPPVISITSEILSEEKKATYQQLDSNKEYYEITLSDNGIGFDQEYADKIFTIFQTLNKKSAYGGYGIGLALCRKIVLTHSGIIYAKASNEGASFTFILPSTQ